MKRQAIIALCLAALALAAAAPVAGQTPEPRASLPDIEDEVMCTVCGTPLQVSAAPQAERERELIRRLIDQGLTKEQIKDELVAEYGENVLATPKDSGFELTAWLLPIGGLAVAVVLAALALAKWRRRGDQGEGVTPALEGEEAERLDADLARYDL